MRHTFLKTSAKILFGLLWFGVFRQDTFAELIVDTKNERSASENNYIEYYDDFNNELDHLTDYDTPHAIVDTVIYQTMYFPLKPSLPSSHIREIFLGSSSPKRDAKFAPMNKPAEKILPQEPIAKSAAILNTRLTVTPSPFLSFKELLESLKTPEINREESIPYSDPFLILSSEDEKSSSHVNDIHQSEMDTLSRSLWEYDDDGYYVPHSPKSPKSKSSHKIEYKDLLLELSSENIHASSPEKTSKIFPSSVSSFDASADSDKLADNSKVVASFSDDTTPSGGSKSSKPSAIEKFFKSILPIFLSPASFDITFPGNETESRPLTETTKTVGFNSK